MSPTLSDVLHVKARQSSSRDPMVVVLVAVVQRPTDFTGDVDMNCVWKLKGLAAGAEDAMAPSGPAESDILLVGRLGETAASGLRNARSRGASRSSMSFQLLALQLLAREGGRSLSRSMASSSSSSSGGGWTRSGRLGGRSVGRPEAMGSKGEHEERRGQQEEEGGGPTAASLDSPCRSRRDRRVGGGPGSDRKPGSWIESSALQPHDNESLLFSFANCCAWGGGNGRLSVSCCFGERLCGRQASAPP